MQNKTLVDAATSGAAPEAIARLIDHTLLKADATPADVQKLCAEAVRHGFCSVCVNAAYVAEARDFLALAPVKVCCVAGFPLGATSTRSKVEEAAQAIRDGAREIDMVLHVGALKSGRDERVEQDIREVATCCRESGALCKVILETCLLNDDEKVRACLICARAGAQFVKTSTGFSTGGATAADIALMARTVAPYGLGVKASGGVRTLADVRTMIAAGATRVGCSSSVRIMEELLGAASAPAAGGGY